MMSMSVMVSTKTSLDGFLSSIQFYFGFLDFF